MATEQELMEALNANDLIKSERLLEGGTDPNRVLAVEGVAPIHIASGTSVEAVRLLLGYGGDPNVRSVEGATPLHVAATWGDQACLRILLQNGGNPYLKDQDDCSVIDSAKEFGHAECVQMMEYYALLSNPEDGCTITPQFSYHLRNGWSSYNSDLDETVQNPQMKPRKSSVYSDLYLDEFLDWAYQTSSKDSSLYHQEISRKLDKFIKSETPVYLDVTSPDHPFLDFKGQTIPDKDPSLHVHWDDPLSSTLPVKNRTNHRESVSSSISTDTYVTCPSEPDQESCSPRDTEIDLLNDGKITNTIHRFNIKNMNSMRDDVKHGSNCEYDSDEEHMCKDCQKLQEDTRELKSGNQTSVTPKPGYRNKKIRCNRNNSGIISVRKSLDDLTIQGTCHSNGKHYEQEQRPIPEIHRMRWQPPLNSLLEESDIMSSDGATENYQKSSSIIQRQAKDNTSGFDLRNLDSLTPNTQARVKERVLRWKEEHFPNFDNLTPKTKSMVRKSWEKDYFPPEFYKPVISSDSDSSTIVGHRDDKDLNVDLDQTLPFDFEQISLDSKSKRQSANSRNSVESITSDVLNRSFYKSRISMDSLCSSDSTVEYVYKDPEKGIILIEKHIPSSCGSSGRPSLDSICSITTVDSQKTELYDWQHYSKPERKDKQNKQNAPTDDKVQQESKEILGGNRTDCLQDSQTTEIYDWLPDDDDFQTGSQSTNVETIPESLRSLSNGEIREKLQSFGDFPGPVTPTTRQTYLVRLWKVRNDPNSVQLGIQRTVPDYPPELLLALDGRFDHTRLCEVECGMVEAFQNPSKDRRWREGTIKSSFNYLLLDPRVTQNLPNRASTLSELEVFRTFIAAIFYVGKGKRARPYSHLYEAITQMQCPKDKVSGKVQHILDIWRDASGVVSLHCFQSVIPVEAYTREACMVDAIGLHKLTNKKRGDYYGISTTWPIKKKRQVGVYLLKKVLQIFLGEGERQISPPDIKVGQ